MTPLVQLQRELQAHVLAQDAAVVASICASDAIPAATRLQIYSDAYRLRVIEALASNYPVLAHVLGSQDFATLAQYYLAEFPSRHFSIRWFGDRLTEFVASDSRYREQRWLQELVRWEWATSCAFDAADMQQLIIEDIAAVTPNAWPALRFAAHPSLQRMQLSTNVIAMVKASVDGDTAPLPATLAATTEWCLWRTAFAVRYRSLDAAEAAAIDVLMGTGTFGDMCAALAAHIAADQVPLHATSLLKTWIDEEWLVKKTE